MAPFTSFRVTPEWRPIRSPGAGEQPAIAVEILREGGDREQRRDGQRDRHETAVELVPELGESAVLPAHGLPGVPEGEPEDDGADEDVLDGRLELARPGRGDHHAAPAGPPAEPRHRDLASDQQEADPERNAAPDRDIVEIV